jgi:hypothetical protein
MSYCHNRFKFIHIVHIVHIVRYCQLYCLGNCTVNKFVISIVFDTATVPSSSALPLLNRSSSKSLFALYFSYQVAAPPPRAEPCVRGSPWLRRGSPSREVIPTPARPRAAPPARPPPASSRPSAPSPCSPPPPERRQLPMGLPGHLLQCLHLLRRRPRGLQSYPCPLSEIRRRRLRPSLGFAMLHRCSCVSWKPADDLYTIHPAPCTVTSSTPYRFLDSEK